MVGYNTAVGTLTELAVDATNGKVALLAHHTILECGTMLVPPLVSGQLQGGVATGIGLALHEGLPLYEDGPGNGTWNFNRYHLPRGGDVAVWGRTAQILPPLSDGEPPKGMAEVVAIPIMAAIVNGIAHAIGHRFRTLPVMPEQTLKALG
jgi:CO/xanthine dehydrogenase Mo-binding subunit